MNGWDGVLALLQSYKGRDRVLRLLCYSSKCAAGLIKSPVTASQFDNFSKQLSTSRACFRLLDDIPTLVNIVRSKDDTEGTTIDRLVSTIENFVDVIFSPLDHISWAIEHRIIISNSTFWDTASIWCWVISLYISIYKTMKALLALAQKKARLSSNPRQKGVMENISTTQWTLQMSALKYVTDLLFAVNYLPKGWLWAQFFNKWQVGALGSFSSVVSLYQALML